jgi:hypothetical protein
MLNMRKNKNEPTEIDERTALVLPRLNIAIPRPAFDKIVTELSTIWGFIIPYLAKQVQQIKEGGK